MSRLFDDEIIARRIERRMHELKSGYQNVHEFTSEDAKNAAKKRWDAAKKKQHVFTKEDAQKSLRVRRIKALKKAHPELDTQSLEALYEVKYNNPFKDPSIMEGWEPKHFKGSKWIGNNLDTNLKCITLYYLYIQHSGFNYVLKKDGEDLVEVSGTPVNDLRVVEKKSGKRIPSFIVLGKMKDYWVIGFLEKSKSVTGSLNAYRLRDEDFPKFKPDAFEDTVTVNGEEIDPTKIIIQTGWMVLTDGEWIKNTGPYAEVRTESPKRTYETPVQLQTLRRKDDILAKLHAVHPDHNERLWMVFYLKHFGWSDDDICELIDKNNNWEDYNPEITRYHVCSVKQQ